MQIHGMSSKEFLTKRCKRCLKHKEPDSFPNSSWAKDGKLGFCSPCWKLKMSKAQLKHIRKMAKKVSKVPAVVASQPDKSIKIESSEGRDFFMVIAKGDDGKTQVVEVEGEDVALRQAMTWQIKHLEVTVWRKCEFEMTLRLADR